MKRNPLADIQKERLRQDQLWGNQHHDIGTWFLILGEEYGESCNAALTWMFNGKKKDQIEHLREELVQTAAVAVQIIERIDAHRILEEV